MTWEDLLAAQYVRGGRLPSALDCAGIVEEVNIRAGYMRRDHYPPFPHTAGGLTPADAFREFMAAAHADFELLGYHTRAAQEIGDFVVADPEGNGNGAHMYTLVSKTPRVFLTALAKRGVRTIGERAIRNILSVHRVRRQTP